MAYLCLRLGTWRLSCDPAAQQYAEAAAWVPFGTVLQEVELPVEIMLGDVDHFRAMPLSDVTRTNAVAERRKLADQLRRLSVRLR